MQTIDIVKRFKEIVTPHTDIPECFVEASGYSIISCCLGRFYKIPMSGGKRPNLYLVLASAPAIGRRSEMLKLTNMVKRSAFKNYTSLIHSKEDHDDAYRNEVIAHMLECGSEEGIIDDINYFREKGVNSFCLSSPEFGKVLTSIKHSKGYMAGFDDVLVRLWTGESYYQSSSHKTNKGYMPRFLPEGTYFNLFSTTQKLKHYLDEGMSATGLVRRLLFVSVEGKDLTHYKPPLGRDTEKMEKDLTGLGVLIGRIMFSCHKEGELTNLPLELDAFNTINENATYWEKKARENDENDYYLYQVTRWEHITKISACDALSTLKNKITLENVNRAIQFVDNATKDIRIILEEVVIPKYEKKAYNDKKRMLKLIQEEGANRTKLQQGMTPYGVKKRRLNQYLVEMKNDEDITEEEFNKLYKD